MSVTFYFKSKHIYNTIYNIIVMRTDKTQVQVHAETHHMLQNFVSEAYDSGKILRPTYNEAIRYLLDKVGKGNKK